MRHRGDPRGDGSLDELVALAALVRFSARSSALFREALGGRVQSNLQVSTVLALARRPGRTPTELAEETAVLVPSMSRVLRTLGSAGLVSMSPDPTDGRVRRLALTEAGAEGLDRFRASLAEYARSPEVRALPGLLGVAEARDGSAPLDAYVSRLAQVGGAFTARVREAAGDRPPAGPPTWVLLTLCARVIDPRPATLSEWLCMSRPAMTGHLDRLEADGLIVRLRPAEGDQRAVELAPTPAGVGVCAPWRVGLRAHAPAIGGAMADLVAAAETPVPATGP